MSIKAAVITSWISLLTLTFSCSNVKDASNSTTESPSVIASFQTPIIRGAANLKGQRIGLQLKTSTSLTLDSLKYENLVAPVNILRESNDTIWVDAYFYPTRINKGSGKGQNKEFTSNTCLLYFHTKENVGELMVTEIKLIQNPTRWQ